MKKVVIYKWVIIIFCSLIFFQCTSKPYLQKQNLIWPLENFVITQGFDEYSYHYQQSSKHWGIDIYEAYKAPVRAVADGIIAATGSENCPNFEEPECNYRYGNWIAVWHPSLGFHTFYGHLYEKTNLTINTPVHQGEIIGYQGGSGFHFSGLTNKEAKGSHLHFSVAILKSYTTSEGITDLQLIKLYNPMDFLPKTSFDIQ